MITGHGGDIHAAALKLRCSPREIIDMSSNVNPLGPPPGLMAELRRRLTAITRLPPARADGAVDRFAAYYGIDSRRVLAGNGTTEWIYTLPQAVGAACALILGPTYSDYADACRMHGLDHEMLPADAQTAFNPDLERLENQLNGRELVFVCNPNNPTGGLIQRDRLETLCCRHPQTTFVIDESYLPFAGNVANQSMIHCAAPNVLVLNSMSKFFKIPGLRIGFIVAHVDTIARLRHYVRPWTVNALAQAAVEYLMTQPETLQRFTLESLEMLATERELFSRRLADTTVVVFPSVTSFVLLKLPEHLDARLVQERLLSERILVRNCANFSGLSSQFIRVSLKTAALNRLVAELMAALSR